MKVLVLGATGGTGKAIVAEAQRAGHEVRALVRSRAKAEDLDADLVVGDARNPAAVASAVRGCDAAISAIGTPVSPFKAVTLLSEATAVLLTAMRRQNVRRLVCITGMGAGDSRGHGGFAFDRLFLPLMLRHVYVDKDRQEALVRDSGLDWVLVRPSVLNDRPASGHVRALTDLTGFRGGGVPRQDVAAFVVRQLTGDDWLRQAPLVTQDVHVA